MVNKHDITDWEAKTIEGREQPVQLKATGH